MLGDDVLAHAHLDAEHQVGVLSHRLGGGFRLRVVDVVELRHGEAGEADVGDVHEGIEAGPRLADDGAAEGCEVVGAGVAGGDQRGRALERQQLVGGDADGGAVGEDVGVQVDEAGGDELARRAQNLQGLVGGDVRLQCLDEAIADADVAFGPEALARVEHLAALDEKIELVVGSHGRQRRAACQPRRGERQGRCRMGHELPTRYDGHGRSSELACAGRCTRAPAWSS
jgi:hypothetical protein